MQTFQLSFHPGHITGICYLQGSLKMPNLLTTQEFYSNCYYSHLEYSSLNSLTFIQVSHQMSDRQAFPDHSTKAPIPSRLPTSHPALHCFTVLIITLYLTAGDAYYIFKFNIQILSAGQTLELEM